MLRKKCFKILGLPDTSSEKEIRKRYRNLVMKYHPDKNHDPNAHELFVKITEAYNILLNKSTITNAPTVSAEEEKKAERLERIRKAKARQREQILRERIENELYYRKLTSGRKWSLIKVLAMAGIVLSSLLILDQFLPSRYFEDEVTHYAKNVGYGPSGKIISLIKTEKNNNYWISRMTYSLYGKTRSIYIETSSIFHNPIRIISKDKLFQKYFDIHFTIYGSTYLLAPVFLIPAFTLFYKRKKISFTFFFYLSYYGISGLIILFLLTGNRWAHLLTLGFL